MLIKSDIEIGYEQAKQFAMTVYDDFVEYMKSQTNNENKSNNVKKELN